MPRKGESTESLSPCPTCGHVMLPPGEPSNAVPFGPQRQAIFLGAVTEGSSRRVARHLAGVSKATITRWLKLGRDGTTQDAVAFRDLYLEACAAGSHKIVKKLYETEDDFIRIQVARATLPEFGAMHDLKREGMRIGNDKARADLDMIKLRAQLLKLALEKAAGAGKDGAIAFGLASILADDGLTEACRRELAARAVAIGWIAVESGEVADKVSTTSVVETEAA